MYHWQKAIEETQSLIADLENFELPESLEFGVVIDEIKESCGSLITRAEILLTKMKEQEEREERKEHGERDDETGSE